RVGGSLGTAVVAVLLQRGIENRVGGNLTTIAAGLHGRATAPVAQAFATTFGWTLALIGLGVIPAFFLPRQPPAPEIGPTTEAAAEVAAAGPAGSGAPTAGVA